MSNPTRREARRALERAEEELPAGSGWRADLGLPAGAGRAEGWKAELRGDMDPETWEKYVAEGQQ